MLNSRGQVLIVFLILLPVCLLMFAIVVDVGYVYAEKRNIENNVKYAIKYRFEETNESIIYENIENKLKKLSDDYSLNVTNNYISITVRVKIDSLFTKILKINKYEIVISYNGTVENDNLKIRKG